MIYVSLDCGHVFCRRCITGHLDEIHDGFVRTSPEYQPIPLDLLQALRSPLTDLAKCFAAIRQRRENPGPQYNCPTCKMALKHRPVRVFDQAILRDTFGTSATSDEGMDAEGSNVTSAMRERRVLFADYPLL